jgi:hypothetical protein
MLQLILTGVMLGIILAILTSLMWNVAPIIQKEALGEMEDIDAATALKNTKVLFKNRRWVAGFLLAVLGGLTYIFATELAGIVVVQPLMNVGLIALAILATRRLGEEFDTTAIIGIILLICTPIFIAFGGVTEPIMFTDFTGLLIYSAVMGIAIVVMLPVSKSKPLLWGPITSCLQGLAAQFTQWFTLALFGAEGLIAGFIAGLFPLILMGIFTFVAGVYTISIGLQQNPASRFNSITGTLSIFIIVVGGILIYSQTITNIPLYAIGLTFGIIGMILLSRYHK